MKRMYRWRCFACDRANEASATSCSSCGFPAVATGPEIARAQAAYRSGLSPLPALGRPSEGSSAPSLADWRGWRLGMLITGAVLLVIGAYAGNHVLSWQGLGVSVFALMFGLVFVTVAWAARGGTPSQG